MKLDKHVVDMFTELTKPADDVKMEKTCYGTISVVDGTRYVKLDGSDLLVPAASTVKTSHGDRVTVLMKNHSLTVTGNLTAPATDGEGGSSGEAGTAATIEVGTVITGEAGSSAAVTNSGTTSAAVFDFVIPRGDKGEKGDAGPQGPQGEKGDTGTWDGTIPDHEHTTSDITDFPTSLPANGGNANTLGNIPASELERVRTAVIAGEAAGLQWTAMQAKKDDTIIRVQVDADYDRVLLFKSIDGGITWTEIPLGNADTLDGKHADDFIYAHGFLDSIDLDDIKYPCSALALNCVHSPFDMWGTLLVYAGGTGSFTQIYIPTAVDGTPTTMYFRHYGGTGWTTWRNAADGGNADTLDGLHANEIASNPNLLINPDFKINQRGLTTYTGSVYTVDRWKTWPGYTVQVLDTGIKVSTDGSDVYNTYISETVEYYKKLAGKTVTMSICVRSVSVASVLQIFDGTTWHADNTSFNTPGIYSLTVTLPETISQVTCMVCHNFGQAAEISIDWMKLEIGSVATPFCPPDPATELVKCQRYFEVIINNWSDRNIYGHLSGVNDGKVIIDNSYKVTKRTTPSVIVSSTMRLVMYANGALTSILNYPADLTVSMADGITDREGYTIVVEATDETGKSKINQAEICSIDCLNGGYIAFDAEL